MKSSSRFLLLVVLLLGAMLTLLVPAQIAARSVVPCTAPDDGSGTAVIPGPCPYLSTSGPMMIINGLSGATIECTPRLDSFFDITYINGSPAAGGTIQFKGTLTLAMSGTGGLTGFSRTVAMEVTCQVQVAPRKPGDPVQSFDTEMMQWQGQLPIGDPDFDLLRITAGTGFGMPSPGHTTLVRNTSGGWSVDSFFDITYRIDFIGAPGSVLAGHSGSTTGTIRMQQGEASDDCVPLDNGSGSVNLPALCPFTAPSGTMDIIDGLNPGDRINSDPKLDSFFDITYLVGGSLGGENESFKGSLKLDMTGKGGLAGFSRSIVLTPQMDVDAAPRTLGAVVQSIELDMMHFQALMIGDPDFDLLRITAGTGFGMPSPGHTTLTKTAGGNWVVDSFFDIEYRIDFVGAPGSVLAGHSGSTTGTIRIVQGNPAPLSQICIVKYFDENHSQTLDGTELPMPGVQFTLNGLPIGPTDAVGRICVDNLSPGTYTISEIVPAGYVVSFPKSNEMTIQLGADFDTTIVWLNGAARDTVYYRTGMMRDWATAVDGKGKSKAIKCKPVKVDFKFNIVAPNPPGTANGGVKVKIGMLSSGVLYRGKAKTDILMTWSNATDFTYAGTIAGGETLQVDGVGFKGKPVKPAFEWATSQKKTKGKVTVFKMNDLRLPMPNLHNVGEQLYEQSVFPIVIGQSANSNSVTHLKYKDVQKSLYEHAMMHTGAAACLSTKKQVKSLPAKKQDNKLFAEALTLAMNLAASRQYKFPHGLGDLIYDNHKDGGDAGSIPFNGKKVDTILTQVNLFLSCATNPKPVATADDYYNVIKRINDAFSDGTIDTFYWSCGKLILTGVKPLKSIPYLRAEPGVASPRTVIDNPGEMYTGPQSSALMQNYPNPFNPTTTIEFELREPSIVTLKIFNTLGQEVATLIDHVSMEDGSQEIEFDASALPSGVYFYRLVANGIGDPDEGTVGQTFVNVKKMMLVK